MGGGEHRSVAPRTLQDGGFEVVDHDFVGHAPKEVQGVWRARQTVLPRLGERACDVQQAAIAHHQDNAAPRPVCVPDWAYAARAPIPLSPLARGKGPWEASGLSSGAHRAYIGVDASITPGNAGRTQALEDLRGRIGMPFQQPEKLRGDEIALAGVRPGFAPAHVVLGQPIGHRAAITGDRLRALRRIEPLMRVESFALTEAVIIAQDSTAQIRVTTASMSTASSSAAPGAALAGAAGRAASRAKTW